MEIKKIFLDMDGVISDFHKKYEERFKKRPETTRKRGGPKNADWYTFIEEKHFEQLDWFPNAITLLLFVESLKIPVEILSSSGGSEGHEDITKQKIKWLKERNITYKANIVAGRKFKIDYAEPGSVLIDDTKDVIDEFNARENSIGILHTDTDTTIAILKSILNNSYDSNSKVV